MNSLLPELYRRGSLIGSRIELETVSPTGETVFLIVTLIMLLSLLSNSSTIPLWWWREHQRELRLRLCLTNFFCGCSYFVMFLGIGTVYSFSRVEEDAKIYRAKFILRYIDWIFTITNTIWLLKIIADRSQQKYLQWEQAQKHHSTDQRQIPEQWLTLISLSGQIYLRYFKPDYKGIPLEERLKRHSVMRSWSWAVDWLVTVIFGFGGGLYSSLTTKLIFFTIASVFCFPMIFGVWTLVGTGVVSRRDFILLVSPNKNSRSEHVYKNHLGEKLYGIICDLFQLMMILLSAIFIGSLTTFDDSSDEDEARNLLMLKRCLWLCLSLWMVYPCVWLLAEADMINVDREVIAFATVDVLSKSLFAFFMCNVGCTLFDQADISSMRRNQKIAKMRSDFFLQMNHELRTPLNAVIGLSQVMLNSENLSPQQEACSQAILTSAQTLLFTINDVLDFSRLESQGIKLENQSFDLVSCIEETADMVAVRAHEKNIEIITDLADIEPSHFRVHGDPFRLRQIILNLSNNAVKFTKEGGNVTIKLEELSVNEEEQQMKIAIYVTDTGIGIPAAQIKTLFQPFSPATESTMRMYGGSGLGLSICRKLVDLMGGTIEVVNTQEGVGTTIQVILSFPIDSQTIPKPSPLRPKLFVIIDNSLSRDYLSKLLSQWNCDFRFDNATNAIFELTRGKYKNLYDFLLIDARNFEEISKLGEEKIFSVFSQVVVMTKLDQRQNKHNKIKYITKPIKRSVLYTIILKREVQEKEKKKYKNFSQCKLLLAEDNKVNQKVMSLIFKKLGIQFEVASNGLEAYDMTVKNSYDIIMMDVQMPIMDGITAAQKIREAEKIGEIPKTNVIIALTAGNTQENYELCVKAGMNDFMTKPIDIEELQRMLRKYMKLSSG